MSNLRYRMIPQEVLETDFGYGKEGDEFYYTGTWRDLSDFLPGTMLPDFQMAETWHANAEADEWIVLATNGMYRMASQIEDGACRGWIK